METTLPRSQSGRTAVEVARECAAEARAIIRAAFGKVKGTATKGRGNVVTESDLAVERAVLATLKREYPDHAVLSEETASETRAEGWMWVVDPIDGTKNFSQGVPHFAFNLALCYASEPRLGLTLQPLLDEEWLSLAGEGCRLNDAPVTVSERTAVQDAVIGMDMGYDDVRSRLQLETVTGLWPGMQSLRVQGSAALGFAYVAAGRFDLYLQPGLSPWDLAPGLLHVREAGGMVTDREGNPATLFTEAVLAAPPALHADFREVSREFPWRA